MKTVFKTDEIAHIWANRGAAYGRCPGNLSFSGDAISSYATVIGRRIEHKGKEAYVLDGASFSNSTSKAQGHVRRALRDSAKVFYVDCGRRCQTLQFTPATLRDHYVERAKARAAELPSRYGRIRAEQYQSVTSLLERALEVCEFFGLGTVQLARQIAERQAGQAEAGETLRVAREKQLAQQAAKTARELKERTARNVAKAEEFLAEPAKRGKRFIDLSVQESALATLPDELRGRFVAAITAHNEGLLARWLKGDDIELPHDSITYLRAEGDELVTSRGARVPLADAKRTYLFAKRLQSKGWRKNGETHAIGSYQLDAVNEQGIVAGCHRISWAEVDRFAQAQGWAA